MQLLNVRHTFDTDMKCIGLNTKAYSDSVYPAAGHMSCPGGLYGGGLTAYSLSTAAIIITTTITPRG